MFSLSRLLTFAGLAVSLAGKEAVARSALSRVPYFHFLPQNVLSYLPPSKGYPLLLIAHPTSMVLPPTPPVLFLLLSRLIRSQVPLVMLPQISLPQTRLSLPSMVIWSTPLYLLYRHRAGTLLPTPVSHAEITPTMNWFSRELERDPMTVTLLLRVQRTCSLRR
jgi:hypothetical protein